jgi:hypothetical protein
VADAEQVEGFALERGGGGDEPEAGHGGVGGLDLVRQMVARSVSRLAKLCTGRSPGDLTLLTLCDQRST